MRRFRQQIPDSEARRILKSATNGILSLVDRSGAPYGVPMSFIYDGATSIYFHCALSGRKIDCLNNNHKVCFTVIDRDEIHPSEFTTYFRSVIVEGEIAIMNNCTEDIIECLKLLAEKYSPGINCRRTIEEAIGRVLILKLSIKSITGKQAIELVPKGYGD